ncbi:hypothetical protein M8818_005642 [Zalaria obscura]|uniref:Uncharacterized protein n=1 Tax=Zalaria obscura TaxID=2024903 RepID=A0ACC3S8J5_9PEZI
MLAYNCPSTRLSSILQVNVRSHALLAALFPPHSPNRIHNPAETSGIFRLTALPWQSSSQNVRSSQASPEVQRQVSIQTHHGAQDE